jgi:2-polyprenyl-3-methyl-5-hydroxy-6-metoxy-1,4-benzoquinol methylase
MRAYRPPRSDDELLRRYRANYGIPTNVELTADDVRHHLALEQTLTAELRASTPDTRWDTFESCYNRLYSSLPWLTGTGGRVDDARWAAVIGPPPKRIYEVGSGAGGLARALAAAGYEVEATDVSRVRRGVSRETEAVTWGVTDGVHLGRFAEPGGYDAVLSDQVIEHLHPDDLDRHLEGCLALLRPGGTYVFRTPHSYTGPHDISVVFGLVAPVGMHLREYTARELRDRLRASGFEKVTAVLHFPHGVTVPGHAAFASRLYMRYLTMAEAMLKPLAPRTRRQIAGLLPGPLKPRVFLVATARGYSR